MTQKFYLILLATLCAAGCVKPSTQTNGAKTQNTSTQPTLRAAGILNVQSPAFLSLQKLSTQTNPALIVSSFGKDVTDSLYAFDNFAATPFASRQARVLTTEITWPNNATLAPAGMFPQPTLVVAGGFLPPGKVGGLHIAPLTNIESPTPSLQKPFKITKDKYTGPYSWFYHRTFFRDMNGDGRLDIVTARAMFPLVKIPFVASAAAGELLWLEQPAQNATQRVWTEHLMASGPDVNFEMIDLDKNGSEEIIATQFFSEKLTVWWKQGDTYESRIIDGDSGPMFNLSLVDANADGNLDVLATNHVSNGNGAVLVYEIPQNFKNDPWKKHTIQSNIPTTHQGTGQASPGNAVAFYPTAQKEGKPLIVVSGDGAERTYLLTPQSQNPNEWTYKTSDPLVENFGEQASFSAMKSVIGEVIVNENSVDGLAELFIPAFHANKIFVLKYSR